MIDPLVSSPEELKAKLSVLLNESDRSVSTIYCSFVRPFCEATDSFSDVLFPADELFSRPPSLFKIRLLLYEIIAQLDAFSHLGLQDPLPHNESQSLLFPLRSISALAIAIGSDFFRSLVNEFRTVHADRWPLTLAQLEEAVGISGREPEFQFVPFTGKRTHYREADPATPPKPLTTAIRGVFPIQGPQIERVVRIRIKKTEHGPDPTTVRPLLTRVE
jgi:hypothetical protein